ncbi:MAG: inositol-3-phosphate synthase [Myxococcaceae bacterium]
MSRLGVCFVGAGGAVASTVIAGITLMKKGLAPRIGMVTETDLRQTLSCAPLDSMVFGGWDLRDENIYEAAIRERIVPENLLKKVEPELRGIKPWPGVVSPRFLGSREGTNVVTANSHREELEILSRNVKDFKATNKLDRVIIVNLASTERHAQVSDVHRTVAAFEAGLQKNDERISPAMKYLYLACKLGAPHVNFTPSLSKIPALEALAESSGIPIAGEDGKTGQTLLKTALAPAFQVRQLRVDGWFSTNILGNNDGKVLDDPESNKTKVASKLSVLDEILGYEVPDHQVHINYYRPRGDEKEAWDNIDVSGFLGERMQIKINFLCKDSILAAPLVIDLVRLIDVAHRCGERGIQRQLSLFFKAPYHREGERAVNDLFKQNALLQEWVEKVARRLRAAV